jgi:hypothetical protein
VAAVERNLPDRLRGDGVSHLGRDAIDERHDRLDDHALVRVADGEVEVLHERPADLEPQAFDDHGPESLAPTPWPGTILPAARRSDSALRRPT